MRFFNILGTLLVLQHSHVVIGGTILNSGSAAPFAATSPSVFIKLDTLGSQRVPGPSSPRPSSWCTPSTGTQALLELPVALRGGGKGGLLPSKPSSIKGMLTATRPWSWTAGIVPVLITASLLSKADGVSVTRRGVANAITLVITLQGSGNLINSYIDHNYGVDTIATAGDRSIVDAHVSPRVALVLAFALFCVALAAVIPTILDLQAEGQARELQLTFWTGVAMVFSYTCWPFRLKYRGLGDITVFLLFGPMLMQVGALLMSHQVQHWVLPYGVPPALLCEAILHANNMRDIDQDRSAGISTLAMMIGFRASQMLYYALIFSAYIVVGGLAILRVKGCALALLTLPLAVGTLKQCKLGTIRNLDENTAQLHLLFGVLMAAGTLLF